MSNLNVSTPINHPKHQRLERALKLYFDIMQSLSVMNRTKAVQEAASIYGVDQVLLSNMIDDYGDAEVKQEKKFLELWKSLSTGNIKDLLKEEDEKLAKLPPMPEQFSLWSTKPDETPCWGENNKNDADDERSTSSDSSGDSGYHGVETI